MSMSEKPKLFTYYEPWTQISQCENRSELYKLEIFFFFFQRMNLKEELERYFKNDGG